MPSETYPKIRETKLKKEVKSNISLLLEQLEHFLRLSVDELLREVAFAVL